MKTSLELNEATFLRARKVLGTKSKRETVNGALLEVINAERRRKLLERAHQSGLGPSPQELRHIRMKRLPKDSGSLPD